jgi:hypothetical protein
VHLRSSEKLSTVAGEGKKEYAIPSSRKIEKLFSFLLKFNSKLVHVHVDGAMLVEKSF